MNKNEQPYKMLNNQLTILGKANTAFLFLFYIKDSQTLKPG